MSILSELAKHINVDSLLPVVEGLAVEQLHEKGHDFIHRAATIPHATLEQLAHKFGADITKVEAAAAAHADALTALIESFAP